MSVTLMMATAVYAFMFLMQTNSTINAVVSEADKKPQALLAAFGLSAIALTSCGIFLGIALAFLGVALFLMGIKGDIDAEGSSDTFSIKLARMSPGVFAITCSVVLVVTCIVNRPKLEFTPDGGGGGGATSRWDDGRAGDAPRVRIPD